MKRREEMTFWEQIYVVEVAKGVFFTFSKLVRNLLLHIAHTMGLYKKVAASARRSRLELTSSLAALPRRQMR